MHNIFQKVLNPLYPEIKDIFCASCAINHFLKLKEGLPYNGINCKIPGKGKGKFCNQLPGGYFHKYKETFTEEDVVLFFNFLLKGKIPKQNLKKEHHKFIKNYVIKKGYSFNLRKTSPIEKLPSHTFTNYVPEIDSRTIKSNDIPNINNKTRKNAEFFSRIYFLFYHLENSIRNFLKMRLSTLHGKEWEEKLLNDIDLKRSEAIRKETDLSNLFPSRGSSILNYCMWDDYGKIILEYPLIMENKQHNINEIVAHISSMTKIRNAVAHHAETIPKKNLKELDVFLEKFIEVFK